MEASNKWHNKLVYLSPYYFDVVVGDLSDLEFEEKLCINPYEWFV